MSYLATTNPDVIEKKILEQGNDGEENRPPQRFDKVKITFILKLENGVVIEESLNEEKPFEVKVGDMELMRGMNLALITMRVGEKAEFQIPKEWTYESKKAEDQSTRDGKAIWVAKLLEVHRGVKVTKWDLEDEEKLPFAIKCKDEGNALFKQEKWELAEEKYNQAIEVIEWDKQSDRIDLKVQVLYNLALTYSNLKRFVSAMEKINWAINIKPRIAKGYFRKSNVYLAMTEYDRAIEELYKALDIEPENPEILAQIEKVKNASNKYEQDSSKMYGKMFSKGVYENRSTCDYSDNLNPIVELEISAKEKILCIKIELFSNIMPDTVNYFEKLVKEGALEGYLLSECQKSNYLIFDASETDDSRFETKLPENKSNKIKNSGFVFFKPNQKDGSLEFSSQIGISLAPLPWFENKWIPFGYVCSPIDFTKRIENMIIQIEDDDKNISKDNMCIRSVKMF